MRNEPFAIRNQLVECMLLACACRVGLLAFVCEPMADAVVQKIGAIA